MKVFQSTLARSDHYRPEIDGLRALAILAVLFYHTAVPGFSGGFVGVDVFFVISGFLITSIIAKDVSAETFSFRAFYGRRIRRLFPALLAMVLCCTAAAVVLLSPRDLSAYGKSLLAMALFCSNLLFRNEGGPAGYFSSDSEAQVLLHTWTLSVEEQFYLLFPALLLLLTRYVRQRVGGCLLLLSFGSLAMSVSRLHSWPQSAFYDLHSRAWELLLGALLALKIVPPLKWRVAYEAAGLLGVALIAWAVCVYNKDTAFPGLAALLPCVGAGLIIHATAAGPSAVRTTLSVRPLVFVGVISYSLYLWHWPIVTFARLAHVGALGPGDTTLVILASMLMAVLSFELVESPFRVSQSRLARQYILSFGVAFSTLCAAAGLALFVAHGFPGRFPESTQQLIEANTQRKNDYHEWCSNWKRQIGGLSDINFCSLGAASAHKVMFWGDSHVQQLYPAIREIFERGGLRGRAVVIAMAQGCSPTEHLNRPEPGYHCDAFSHFAMLRAQEPDIDAVYIGFSAPPPPRWTLCPSVNGRCVGTLSDEEVPGRVLQELAAHVHTLRARGKSVIVSLPFPEYDKSIPDLQIRNAVLRNIGRAAVATDITLPSVRSRVAAAAESSGAVLFDPRASLCHGGECVTEVGGVSIYRDDGHIAASQVHIMEGELEAALQRALRAEEPEVVQR